MTKKLFVTFIIGLLIAPNITFGSTTYYLNKGYEITDGVPTKHIYAGDLLIGTITGSDTSSSIKYVHSDHLTGSNVITNASGTIEELADYQPYGKIRLDEQTSSFRETKKFTGHQYDAETDLNYMRARYYDPKIGRFQSQDPAYLSVGDPVQLKQKTDLEFEQYLSDPQALNSYSYVKNNPLKYTDPTGEFLLPLLPAIVAATPAVIGLASFLSANAPAVGAIFSNSQTSANLSPGVGDAIGVKEFWTGKDTFTGEELSPGQRVLAGFGAIPGIGLIGDVGKQVIKAGDTVAGLRVTDHAAERILSRNISPTKIQNALDKGIKYLDNKKNTLVHTIGERGKGGYTVVTDLQQKTLVTVENFIQKLSESRYTKLNNTKK